MWGEGGSRHRNSWEVERRSLWQRVGERWQEARSRLRNKVKKRKTEGRQEHREKEQRETRRETEREKLKQMGMKHKKKVRLFGGMEKFS